MALDRVAIGEQVHEAELVMQTAQEVFGTRTDGENLPALLTALMHYADSYGYDANALVREAQERFEKERHAELES